MIDHDTIKPKSHIPFCALIDPGFNASIQPIKNTDSSWIKIDTLMGLNEFDTSMIYCADKINRRDKYLIVDQYEFNDNKVKIHNKYNYFFILSYLDPIGFKKRGKARLKKL